MRLAAPGLMALGLMALAADLTPTVSADETTFCNRYITVLPYTITDQGHYCLNRNLSTGITSGNAITIAADYVLLDLNNFKVGGGSAGLATQAVGVYALDRRNVTVRNGNIRGFRVGIKLSGAASGNLVVENNVVDGNTYGGILTDGDSSLIRNNVVTNTGGSTIDTSGFYGIIANYSPSATSEGTSVARDNQVTGTFGDSNLGIQARVIIDNVVTAGEGTGTTTGIVGTVCNGNVVLDADFDDCAFTGSVSANPD